MSTLFFYFSIFMLGIMATLWIDMYSVVLKRYFNIPSLDYKFVGRWLFYILKGQLTHRNITQSPETKGEKIIGWISHYIIGLIFAALFILIMGQSWLLQPELKSALIFGIASVSIPFLIMQPCFGFGIAASKLPNAHFARLKSLSTHAMFGIGLYLTAECLKKFQ